MPEPLFSVLIDYETLAGRICELANGTAVTPGSLLRYLDKAWIERVVFGSPSRVIDMGARRRLFTGATRRAIQVRDRECFHEFCETRAADSHTRRALSRERLRQRTLDLPAIPSASYRHFRVSGASRWVGPARQWF
jgi:hypothetical protein